jgi:hypothetical protein
MIALSRQGDALLLLQKQKGSDTINGGCIARSGMLILPYGHTVICI